jgi:hypothetical protein
MNQSINISWASGNGGTGLSGSITKTGDTEIAQDIAVAAATSDVQADLALDITGTRLKLLFLQSDQDVVIEVNSTSSPTATINLVAGEPQMYLGTGTNPLGSTDVTGLFLSNAGAEAAIVQVRALYDSTP